MNKLLTRIVLPLFILSLFVVNASAVLASTNLETSLDVYNLTQKKDATSITNNIGDFIEVTATVKNLGPLDLVDYVMQIGVRDVLEYGKLIDLNGGIRSDNFVKYPPILQAADCNCENDNTLSFQINKEACNKGYIDVTYEDKLRRVRVKCDVAPSTTPQTGPALYIFILIAMSGSLLLLKKQIFNR